MSASLFNAANVSNLEYLEQIYAQFLEDPEGIDPSWSNFFKGFEMARQLGVGNDDSDESSVDGLKISRLIREYRRQGHLAAKTNPLHDGQEEELPGALQITSYGFTNADLDKEFPTDHLLEQTKAPLRQILQVLKSIYCDTVAVEYYHLHEFEQIRWLKNRIEPTLNKPNLTIDDKRTILGHLNRSELFENFLHTKYVGQKRFSLEGSEVLIPALADVIETGASFGLNEVTIGMAHRGRLNVLANILNKSYEEIFSEFEDDFGTQQETSGDVKYHKGFTSRVKTKAGVDMVVSLAANPSHLEAVDPVVLGKAKAKQILKDDTEMKKILPILIHGDASMAGQGVVYECTQMAKLEGYEVGGTLHIVINNQIGFTAKPEEGRSSRYCTDVSKIVGAPVFHVNGDDPEAVIHAIRVGTEFLHKFNVDVVIDIVCYRKHGHNEGDEPSFTSPLEYKIIRSMKSTREKYRDALIDRDQLQREMAQTLEEQFKGNLTESLDSIRNAPKAYHESVFDGVWSRFEKATEDDFFAITDTKVSEGLLRDLGERITTPPDDFNVLAQLKRLIKKRKAMMEGEGAIDWAMAEHLAFASLLWDGTHVRLSGQDCRRGTFSQRHAVWRDCENADPHTPLKNLKKDQGRFDVYNSHLSEYAVLGFEYGYSLSYPSALVMWEAQFGDFVNGAQIIVDQFLCSSEQKWRRFSGLVLLLPHGQEGQGPEHSSARVERFLSNCSQNNIQVAIPTTPAQFFHLLRRQVMRNWRRPLVVCTPKGFLRNPRAVSKIEEFTQCHYSDVLPDYRKDAVGKKTKVTIVCSGKVFYDLDVEREKRGGMDDFAIIRLESIYPFNRKLLRETLDQYGAPEVRWVQEEPVNQGAYSFVRDRLEEILTDSETLSVASRPGAASPAVGSKKKYDKEFAELMDSAFQL
jgi:2-oxoglutarate dehydrogenase E1 component